MKKDIYSGNEAIARGIYESGVRIVSGYPGTPCTSILEFVNKKYHDIYCEWSVNEKVALEVAMGSSFAGFRSVAIMKTVGLNVAHDALMSASQSQINGGLVIVVADDVGRITDDCNDCRFFAESANIPILEPSDSNEALLFTKISFSISEKYSLPVIIRLTSILCKTDSEVNFDDNYKYKVSYHKKYDISGYAILSTTMMIGMNSCKSPTMLKYYHNFEENMHKLKNDLGNYPINILELKNKAVGFITSGIPYYYIKEILPEASILKIGLTNPLPRDLIQKISNYVDYLYIIEDGRNILEKNIRNLGFINVIGEKLFPKFPKMLYFTPDIIAEKFVKNYRKVNNLKIPFRLPMNCAGCSHLFIYYILKKHNIKASSDVTCGGLGIFPHINAFCNAKHMGSSIAIAHGYNISKCQSSYVAVIGDGGFWATGINGLINLVYNSGSSTVIIVDNNCVAMTGGQSLPSGNFGMHYKEKNRISIEGICNAIGIEDVHIVDPYDIDILEESILNAVNKQKNSVVIVRRECLIRVKEKRLSGNCHIEKSLCVKCKSCLKIGCIAIERKIVNNYVSIEINKDLCVGCKLCMQICKKGAIKYNG